MNLVKVVQKSSPVFLDTAIFIYLFEDHPKYAQLLQPVFDAITAGRIHAFTSVISVAEVLTKPYEMKDTEMVRTYYEVFSQLPGLSIVHPIYQVAVAAAQIRAAYQFHLLDSFQLAIAKENGCVSFLTNDKKLAAYKDLKILLLT